ncbi:hypothetical protein [Halorubrum sp. SP9]|uniref:hypothetical protein n=3 Tax=unclassified Halorubrum TaxID=2642239 RepID=UPI0010F8C4D6|nr:hypothetical protein [Halorubrum sp. SP9]TKX67439.1 hypothetical protein EXE45_14210 [Halorubrum sp. SP9]
MASGSGPSNTIKEQLRAAAEPHDSPAELRSRRYIVSKALDESEPVTESLDIIWSIYFDELERPVSTVDEFAQIDRYTTEIREICAKIFRQTAESSPESLTTHLTSLNRSVRSESVEYITLSLLDTLQHLCSEDLLPNDDSLDVIRAVRTVGEATDSNGIQVAVVATLREFASMDISANAQQEAGEALRMLAEHYEGQQRIFALGSHGVIGAKNGFSTLSEDAIEGILSEMESAESTGEIQRVLSTLHEDIEENMESVDPAKAMSVYEAGLRGWGLSDDDFFSSLLEVGADIDNPAYFQDYKNVISAAIYSSKTHFQMMCLLELKRIFENTPRTKIKRKAIYGLVTIGQASDNLFIQHSSFWGIAQVAERINDPELCEDLVSQLKQGLRLDNYLIRGAAALAIGETVAGSGSIQLARNALDILKNDLLPETGTPLYGARSPIMNIAARSSNRRIQELVLETVRSIVDTESRIAAEIFMKYPLLLCSLDKDLEDTAVEVIQAGLQNTHTVVRTATIDGIPGKWIAERSHELQNRVFQMLNEVCEPSGAEVPTQLSALRTCHEYFEATDSDDRVDWVHVLLENLSESENLGIKVFALASLVQLDTKESKDMLLSEIETNRQLVKIGFEWSMDNLPLTPPNSDTTSADILALVNFAVGDADPRLARFVTNKTHSEIHRKIDVNLRSGLAFSTVVEKTLRQGELKLRRDLIAELAEHAENFDHETRLQLIPALSSDFSDNNASIEAKCVETIGEICVNTVKEDVWMTTINHLVQDIENDSLMILEEKKQVFNRMAKELPMEGPEAALQDAFLTILSSCTATGASVLEGMSELQIDRSTFLNDLCMNSEIMDNIPQSASYSDLSESGRTLTTGLLVYRQSNTRIDI